MSSGIYATRTPFPSLFLRLSPTLLSPGAASQTLIKPLYKTLSFLTPSSDLVQIASPLALKAFGALLCNQSVNWTLNN